MGASHLPFSNNQEFNNDLLAVLQKEKTSARTFRSIHTGGKIHLICPTLNTRNTNTTMRHTALLLGAFALSTVFCRKKKGAHRVKLKTTNHGYHSSMNGHSQGLALETSLKAWGVWIYWQSSNSEPLTSLSRPSSCLLRLPFSHFSASFSDKATFSLASSESRYSFFFFRERDADSRFFIMRCCRWEILD